MYLYITTTKKHVNIWVRMQIEGSLVSIHVLVWARQTCLPIPFTWKCCRASYCDDSIENKTCLRCSQSLLYQSNRPLTQKENKKNNSNEKKKEDRDHSSTKIAYPRNESNRTKVFIQCLRAMISNRSNFRKKSLFNSLLTSLIYNHQWIRLHFQ